VVTGHGKEYRLSSCEYRPREFRPGGPLQPWPAARVYPLVQSMERLGLEALLLATYEFRCRTCG